MCVNSGDIFCSRHVICRYKCIFDSGKTCSYPPLVKVQHSFYLFLIHAFTLTHPHIVIDFLSQSTSDSVRGCLVAACLPPLPHFLVIKLGQVCSLQPCRTCSPHRLLQHSRNVTTLGYLFGLYVKHQVIS